MKIKPKKIETYLRTIDFNYEPTYEERDSVIRRCIYREQDANKGKNLKWIVIEKTMKRVVIKFTRKAKKTN
jgi:hypothetical protein